MNYSSLPIIIRDLIILEGLFFLVFIIYIGIKTKGSYNVSKKQLLTGFVLTLFVGVLIPVEFWGRLKRVQLDVIYSLGQFPDQSFVDGVDVYGKSLLAEGISYVIQFITWIIITYKSVNFGK